MGRFDFIESAASGYRFLMLQHELVGRMMLVPLLVKITSFVVITALALDDNYLRQGLMLIPSFFFEGWLVAQLARLAIFEEDVSALLTGDRRKDMEILHTRFRAVMAATLIYVLTKLVISFVSGLALQANGGYQNTAAAVEPSSGGFLAAFIALGIAIWSFRYLWLYIPAALDYPMEDFLKRIRSFKVSVLMIATWMLCFIPLALMFMMISEVLVSIFPADASGEVSMTYRYIMVCVQAVLELLITIVSSVAMAYGLSSFYKKGQKRR
ncbi:MAG: hypothetical protein KDJ35_08270 [Alphaproteobacteria bacterium]|nr:hypothetical protein [Alphaproteobacteria bacterium]